MLLVGSSEWAFVGAVFPGAVAPRVFAAPIAPFVGSVLARCNS